MLTADVKLTDLFLESILWHCHVRWACIMISMSQMMASLLVALASLMDGLTRVMFDYNTDLYNEVRCNECVEFVHGFL